MNDLNPEARQALGARIDAARRSQGLSYVMLAHRTGYDERTIRNAVTGRSTRVSTLADICKALDIAIEGERGQQTSVIADDAHGGYTLAQYADYVGTYYSYRRSFSSRGSISKSIMDIDWSKEARCLVFNHFQRSISGSRFVDSRQNGEIYISAKTGLLHLNYAEAGALGLMMLTKLRLEDSTMHGVVLTSSEQAFYHKPSVSAVLLQRQDTDLADDALNAQARSIPQTDDEFGYINDYLLEIEKSIGVFAIGTWGIERRGGRDGLSDGERRT